MLYEVRVIVWPSQSKNVAFLGTQTASQQKHIDVHCKMHASVVKQRVRCLFTYQGTVAAAFFYRIWLHAVPDFYSRIVYCTPVFAVNALESSNDNLLSVYFFGFLIKNHIFIINQRYAVVETITTRIIPFLLFLSKYEPSQLWRQYKQQTCLKMIFKTDGSNSSCSNYRIDVALHPSGIYWSSSSSSPTIVVRQPLYTSPRTLELLCGKFD